MEFPETNRLHKVLLWCLSALSLTCYSHFLGAQIVICSPVHNQILQRNLKDSAFIAVTGYSHRPYQLMEIRLEALNGSSKPYVEIVLENQLLQGFFHSVIPASKGWHRLSATAIRIDGKKDTVSVGRVGVGEIFLIGGSSNAMGVQDLGAIGSSENVVVLDTVNKTLNKENITIATDEPLRALTTLNQFSSKRFSFPAGETSWIWGELGDILYRRFGTPVMFLNAGWAAANSVNYRESASGKDTFNGYVNKFWPYRQPYTNIPNTLRYFNSWLGIRAILWAHGETDVSYLKIDQESYFKNIQYLIQRTREDFGHNVPWVIGRHSMVAENTKPYTPVALAQTALGAQKDFNTWPGPDTDTIQIPRPAHGHFENVKGGVQGLSLSAAAWSRSLPDSFFKSIIPLQPSFFLHAGVIPGYTFPGADFTIPFAATGNLKNLVNVQAELLSNEGNYVALVGNGKTSPLPVKIPITIPNGYYRIRIVATNPVLVGSVSESFEIHRKNKTTGYINHLKAQRNGAQIDVSWVMAANASIRQVTLQKSTDHISYSDIIKWNSGDNVSNSKVYAHTDRESNLGAVFYRIRMDYENGRTDYSQALVLFDAIRPPALVVYPNPVTDQSFFLRPETPDEPFICKLYDTAGKEHPITTDNRQIIGLTVVKPLYHLPVGAYILRIHTSSRILTQRVMFR